METNGAAIPFVILGLIIGVIGLFSGSWMIMLVGANWFIAGITLASVNREISAGAFFTVLLFGVIAVILWLLIEISNERKP